MEPSIFDSQLFYINNWNFIKRLSAMTIIAQLAISPTRARGGLPEATLCEGCGKKITVDFQSISRAVARRAVSYNNYTSFTYWQSLFKPE